MIGSCQAVPSSTAFAPGVISYLDCQAQTLGSQGYLALAAPGSAASVTLGAMLTLFIAFIGYRMLFGQTPTVRDGVLSFVKIGIVLALATSWPAYQVLIYNVVLHGPTELAAAIGAPGGLAGSAGGLAVRLDGVDQAFQSLAVYGVGSPPPVDPAAPVQPLYPPAPWLGFDTFALGTARAVFLAGAIGAFAVVRIGAGLLLALGPLFIAFLLFEGTRGLFEGWARGLIGAALGALATSVVLGIELSLLEPWLIDLLNRRAADIAIPGVPAQLLAVTVVFVVVLGAMIALTARVAFGLKLPISWPDWSASSSSLTQPLQMSPHPQVMAPVPIENRSRALAVADAIANTQRREALVLLAASGQSLAAPARGVSVAANSRDRAAATAVPLGQSYRRRTTTRRSARAGARDRAS